MKDIEISERKLEDMVFEILKNQDKYPDKFDFLEHSDLVIRQLNLNNYGIPDIVTFSYDVLEGFVVNIYELKKDTICLNTLIQALRYKQGIRSFFEHIGIEDIPINIFLIGSCFEGSSGLFKQISKATTSSREYVRVAEYEYGVNGIYFVEYEAEPDTVQINHKLKKLQSCIGYLEIEESYPWYKKIDSCPDVIIEYLKKTFE